jgi:hypothetical protein
MAGTVGFEVLPRCWAVERTLAWLNRNRRLAKDSEATVASAKALALSLLATAPHQALLATAPHRALLATAPHQATGAYLIQPVRF